MLNIMGSFVIQSQVLFNFIEKSDPDLRASRFYGQRILIVQCVLVLTVLFPDINVVLSLFTGSICGTILLVLPVVFYRAAYIENPSKKDRSWTLYWGYLSCCVAVPIGVCGVVQNLS